jgi:hypothetical protein
VTQGPAATVEIVGVVTPQFDPQSIDAAVLRIARRRQLRERISVICAGVVVTAMVATFYRILAS